MTKAKSLVLLCLLAFLLAPQAHAQNTTFIVNGCQSTSGGSAVSSQPCTFTVGAHHAVVGFVHSGGSSSFNTPTDTLGLSYSNGSTFTDTNGRSGTFWVCDTGSSGGADTITSTAPTAGGQYSLTILEYQGVPTTSCTEACSGSTNASGNSTSPNSGSCTTSNATDLLVSFAIDTDLSGSTWTAGSGYTLQSIGQTANAVLMQDQLVGSTGSYASTASLSPSAHWGAALVVFKQQAATPCNPVVTDPFFVQGSSSALNNGYIKNIALPCHSATGNTILVAFNLVQSVGNHSPEVPTVADSDGNTYTKRFCQDGGSGNQTHCIYETKATTNNLLVATISYTPKLDVKRFNVAVHEYKRLGSFVASSQCFGGSGTSCNTSTPFSTGANTFYFTSAGWQGFTAPPITFTGPAGYTQRELSNTASGTALVTYDDFIPAAQGPNYSVAITSSDGSDVTAYSTALLTYSISPAVPPRHAQTY